MPRYYFDHHDSSGVVADEEGFDLPDAAAAKRLAIRSVGQLIMDKEFPNPSERVTIEVRADAGPILRVSAVVDVAVP